MNNEAKMKSSLMAWRVVAIVLIVSDVSVIAVKQYWEPTQKPVQTALILCDGVYLSKSGKPALNFGHCAQSVSVYPQASQCERAKEAAAWALQSGMSVRPDPWVTRSDLVLSCIPNEKLNADESKQSI